MRGQIEVRFITAITLALATLFTAIVINNIAVKGSNEEITATDLEVLWQLTRVADKYTGETLSYAYYEELNRVFDPHRYSDEPDESWTVPPWFIYPSVHVATCESVDNKLGCVVWNLHNTTGAGSDPKHPCPEITSYSPNPPANPANALAPMSVTNIENYQTQAFQEANRMLAEGTTTGGTLYGLSLFGKSISIDPSISVSANGDKTTVTSFGKIDVRLLDSLGGWSLEVNRTVDTNHELTASMLYREKTAYCVCKKTGSTHPEVIGRYRVGEYYVHIAVENKKTGDTVVEGDIPYVKYFVGWDYQPVYDGTTTYQECELIVP